MTTLFLGRTEKGFRCLYPNKVKNTLTDYSHAKGDETDKSNKMGQASENGSSTFSWYDSGLSLTIKNAIGNEKRYFVMYGKNEAGKLLNLYFTLMKVVNTEFRFSKILKSHMCNNHYK